MFSAPNYCGEFDNSGAMMSVDEALMCSFQILKPADKKKTFGAGFGYGMGAGGPGMKGMAMDGPGQRPTTPPKK